MGRTNCRLAIALVATLLVSGCAASRPNPYANDPTGPDPRARPLAKREGIRAGPEQIAAEFRALKRPIIAQYIEVAVPSQDYPGSNRRCARIVLTGEACAFIQRYTVDELRDGLDYARFSDWKWFGDVLATECVAFARPGTGPSLWETDLADRGYHSPEDPGTWDLTPPKVSTSPSQTVDIHTKHAPSKSDPYARNLNQRDPRVHPLLVKRNGTVANPAEVAAEFKALKRPIIERFVRYTGQTLIEAYRGENPEYVHIVLADEACAFVNRHTFDELAIGLSPVLPDPYWNGDVLAVICVAANRHFELGRKLADSGYHSPDDPGKWSGRLRKYPGDIPFAVTCLGGTVAIDLYDGTIVKRTSEDMERERRGNAILRKHDLK